MSRSIEYSSREPQALKIAIDFNNFTLLVQQTGGNQVPATVNATIAARYLSDESRIIELVARYNCQTPDKKIIFQQPFAVVTGNELNFLPSLASLILKGLKIADYHLREIMKISPRSRFTLSDLHGNVLNEEERIELRQNAG